MKRQKRLISVLMAALMLTVLAGIQPAQASSGDDAPPTTLSWYYIDQQTSHTDVVWAELNKYLEETINVNIDYHLIESGLYSDKMNTIKASGQNTDIIFCFYSYTKDVASGAGQPIEDYLSEYGSDMVDTFPQFIWDAATIGGHIYGKPVYKDNAYVPGTFVNKTMADDLGVTLPESYGSYEELEALFYEVKEKRDEKYPEQAYLPITKINNFFNAAEEIICSTAAVNIPGIESYAGKGSGELVFNYWDTSESLEHFKKARQWTEDGIYPMEGGKFDEDNAVRDSGQLFADASMGLLSCDPHFWSDDFEVTVIPCTYRFMATASIIAGANMVSATSEHPAEAVKFLNLVNTDNYVANTLRFGIEGDYYNINADGRIDVTGTLNSDPANRAYYKWYGWWFGNIFAMTLPAREPDTLWTDLKTANETAYLSANLGFSFDATAVANELAACDAVTSQYRDNLFRGLLPDVETEYQAALDKLETAGINTIIDEVQRQLNEWRTERGLAVVE